MIREKRKHFIIDTIRFMFETQYIPNFNKTSKRFLTICAKFKMNIHLKILIELALSFLMKENFALRATI